MTKDDLLRTAAVDVMALLLATSKRESWANLSEDDRRHLKNVAAAQLETADDGSEFCRDNTNAIFRIVDFLLRHLPECDPPNEKPQLVVSRLVEYLTRWGDDDIRARDQSDEAVTIRRQQLAAYCREIISQLPHHESELPIVRAVRQWAKENPAPNHPRDMTMLRFHTALEEIAVLAHGIRPREA